MRHQIVLPKRNQINELYYQLSGIKSVADGMTNVGVAWEMSADVQNQIHGISQSIMALTEKADKLVAEIEQATHYEKPIIVPDTPKQQQIMKSVSWSYWQDDVSEINGLIDAAINLSEYEDSDGSRVVLNQALSKADFLNERIDMVNAGKPKNEIYAYRHMKVAS